MRVQKMLLMIALLLALTGTASAQINMNGYVYGNDGEPLVGTYITINGTQIRTLTDFSGHYSLDVPAEYQDSSVVFHYVQHLPHIEQAHAGRTDVYMEVAVEKEVDDIYVSTQKRKQTSVEVPIAVTAIDRTRLDELNAYKIDEVSGFVPGFNAIVQSQNKSGYSIRGVTSDGMESFFQPRISVFLNGVSNSRAHGAVMEIFDMERIEIVKGPQGTLFGRGAEIGAVHYITNRPERIFSAQASANYGSYNQRGLSGYVNIPFAHKFADRFAFCYDQHDGYIDNLAGGCLNGKGTIALRNTLSFYQNDKSTLNLILDFQYDDTPGVSFKSNRLAPEGGDTSPFTAAYLNGGKDLGVKRHTSGITLEYESELNSNFNISNTLGFRSASGDEFYDADGTYLSILNCEEYAESIQLSEEFRLNWDNHHNLNGFVGVGAMYETCEHTIDIKSTLHYLFPICVGPRLKPYVENLPVQVSEGVKQGLNAYKEQLIQGKPDVVAAMISEKFDPLEESVYNELLSQMSAHLDAWFNTLEWVEAPDLFSDTKNTITSVLVENISKLVEDNPEVTTLLGGATPEQLVATMNFDDMLSDLKKYSNLPLGTDYNENETDKSRNFETDIFADLNWNIAKGLYLTFGLRGTYEKQKLGYYSTAMTAPMVGTMVYGTTNGETVWTDKDYLSWVGRFVVNYMPNKYNNIYLSVAKGRRPGVIYFNYTPDSRIELKPEETYNFELGLKGNIFKNTLSYGVAAYYYNWRHFQSSTMQMTDNGTLGFVNDDNGKANCMGAEFSMKYYFSRYVTMFSDFTYYDGKFADKGVDGNIQELAGNRFRLSSKNTFDIGFDIIIPIREKYNLYIRPNYFYRSKMYFYEENNEEFTQDDYGLLNATAGVKFTSGRLTYDFGVWGKNITNTEYLIDGGNAGKVIGFPTFIAGMPATFGVKFSVTFNQSKE